MKSRCWYCGNFLFKNAKKDKNRPSLDHLTPTSRGGKNIKKNKVRCCIKCNNDKGGLTLNEYRLVVAFRKGLLINWNGEDFILFHGEKQ